MSFHFIESAQDKSLVKVLRCNFDTGLGVQSEHVNGIWMSPLLPKSVEEPTHKSIWSITTQP